MFYRGSSVLPGQDTRNRNGTSLFRTACATHRAMQSRATGSGGQRACYSYPPYSPMSRNSTLRLGVLGAKVNYCIMEDALPGLTQSV